MARSSEQEVGKASSRQRKLNLIYFIDSARTKSLSIAITQLRLVALFLLILISWSTVSIVIIEWLHREKIDLQNRLETSLNTIFNYESRYDGVYERAYPTDKQKSNLALNDTAQFDEIIKDTNDPMTSKKINGLPAPTTNTSETKPAIEPIAQTELPKITSDSLNMRHAPAGSAAEKPEVKVPTASSKPLNAQEKPSAPRVTVANPVLEPKTRQLDIRFDLSNESDKPRVEGYLWVIAEFKTEEGKKLYMAAPQGVEVNDAGEPVNSRHFSSFGIKRFTRKSFSFPYIPDRKGSFTSVRIGVMNKTGNDRITYNVPINIRIPINSL